MHTTMSEALILNWIRVVGGEDVQFGTHDHARLVRVDRSALLEKIGSGIERVEEEDAPAEQIQVYDIPWWYAGSACGHE